jgi:hypothetical protein
MFLPSARARIKLAAESSALMNPFDLDATSLAVLKDIFERSLTEGGFVNADNYRVAKNELRPLIDKLERRRFIIREGQGQTEYRVGVLALIALDYSDTQIELGRCAGVFGLLQDHYRNTQMRQKQKFFSEIGKELRLSDAQVRSAVLYLRDSGRWIAGGSPEITPPDQAWVRPNEHVMDYQSFDDVLQELIQNNVPKVIEPVGVTDPKGQKQRALALLLRIKGGERSLQPNSQSQADIQSFQDVARELDWLFRQGYLQSLKSLRESQSGSRHIAVVQVGDLTYEGVLLLEHLQSESLTDERENMNTKQDRAALHPWPIVRGFLLRLDSYDVPGIIDRAGLTVDWQLSERENYSHKMRLSAFRGRIDKTFQELPTEEDRLRVAYIVAREISAQVPLEELNQALREIGWEVRENRLAPVAGNVRELFFGDKSEHDAYVEIRALLQKARKELTIVDPYVDATILTLLSTCTKPGMVIRLLTSKVPSDFALEAKKWIAQHKDSVLEVRTTKEFHDRFVVLDGSVCWHVGASIKDAGRKAFMLSQIEDEANRVSLIAQVGKSWSSATPAI